MKYHLFYPLFLMKAAQIIFKPKQFGKWKRKKKVGFEFFTLWKAREVGGKTPIS